MGIIFDKPGLLSNFNDFENLKLRFLSLEKLIFGKTTGINEKSIYL